jgi:hypothetical protein
MAAYMLVFQKGYMVVIDDHVDSCESLVMGGMVFVKQSGSTCSVERAMNAANACAGMLGRKTEESHEGV